MKRNYILQNEDTILRPVTVADAELIVRLRNQPHVQGKVHFTSGDISAQEKWIFNYLQRDNDFYWIIETLEHQPIGTQSLYNFNPETGDIESGRWVLLRNTRVNVMANRILNFDFAFNVLKAKRILWDVVVTNESVIRYSDMCGSRQIKKGKIQGVGSEDVEVIWYGETLESWSVNRKRLIRYCKAPDAMSAREVFSDGRQVEVDISGDLAV